MKICILSPSLDTSNGFGNFTHNYVTAMAKHHQIDLLLPKTNQLTIKNNKIRIFNLLPNHIVTFHQIHSIDYFFWSPPKLDFEIVHTLNGFPYAFLGQRLAGAYHKPLIITTHGTYGVEPLTHQPEKYFLSKAYNYASAIQCPSDYTANMIRKLSHTRTPIQVIPIGINLAEFTNNNQNKLKRSVSSNPVLVGICALKKRKGVDIAIKAIAKVKANFPKIKYYVIGDGPDKLYLKKLINQLNLSDNVFLLGNLSRHQLLEYLRVCDLYLHTPTSSNYNFEGFGIVYLEAAAFGKPSVASQSGGVPSAVVDGETGILARENSPQSTSKAITKLLTDHNLYSQMSKKAIKWSRDHDWEIIATKFNQLYQAGS